MTKSGLILLATLVLQAPLATADDGVRRQVTERRPYIVEIGDPYSISMNGVRSEAGKISQMRTYLEQYGYPDYAEVQEIAPQWPWESYEVRLFYVRRNLEIDFGHVFLSEALPGFGAIKYQGGIPPDKRHQIDVILAAREDVPLAAPPAEPATQSETTNMGISEALVARIEAAAERAAQAADRAVESSEAARRAAERTVTVVDQFIAQNEAP